MIFKYKYTYELYMFDFGYVKHENSFLWPIVIEKKIVRGLLHLKPVEAIFEF